MPSQRPTTDISRKMKCLLVTALLLHFLFPLRWMIYTTDPNWARYSTEFSWRLRVNDYRGGLDTKFHIRFKPNPYVDQYYLQFWNYQNHTLIVSHEEFLDPVQVPNVGCYPSQIHQFSYALRDLFEANTGFEIEAIYVEAVCSLNYRQRLPLIDPNYNLLDSPLWHWPLPFVCNRES